MTLIPFNPDEEGGGIGGGTGVNALPQRLQDLRKDSPNGLKPGTYKVFLNGSVVTAIVQSSGVKDIEFTMNYPISGTLQNETSTIGTLVSTPTSPLPENAEITLGISPDTAKSRWTNNNLTYAFGLPCTVEMVGTTFSGKKIVNGLGTIYIVSERTYYDLLV